MDFPTSLATVSKAIAGAVTAAIVALLARYGFGTDQALTDALGVLVTAIVSGIIGFCGVYLAPKNKEGVK